MRVANRHTSTLICSIPRFACTVIGSLGIGTDGVLVAAMLTSCAFVDLDAIPFVGSYIARQTFTLVGTVDVDTSGVHVAMMAPLATPLQTLICIFKQKATSFSISCRVK